MASSKSKKSLDDLTIFPKILSKKLYRLAGQIKPLSVGLPQYCHELR